MKTRAAILYETGKPLVVREIEIPELKRGQALVQVLYSGVCHSQLNEIKGLKGKDSYLPHLLGHEGSGIVESVGEGVTKVKPGDYVVLSWIKGRGLEVPSTKYLCGEEEINCGAVSTFSEKSVTSENRLVKISRDIPPKIAALLGCAVPTGAGIVMHDLGKAGSLAIYGIGGIGSSALLEARARGYSPIIAIDIHKSKLQFAKDLGASHLIDASKGKVVEKIMEITQNKGVDYAIEASGAKVSMENAFQCLSLGGKAVLAGNLKKGETISIDPFELKLGKGIYGSWGGSTKPDEDIPMYQKRYLAGKLPLEKLITREYSLDEINKALKDLENRRVCRAIVNLRAL